MQKILLMQPFPYKSNREKIYSDRLPLGLIYLGEVIKNHRDIQVELLDLSIVKPSFDLFRELVQSDPDLVGISVHSTAIAPVSYHLTEIIREALPHCKIVGGGAHVSVDPFTALIQSQFDIIVRGEGENIFLNLVGALEGSGDLRKVKGIVFKDKDLIVDTGEGALPELKSLPVLPSSLIDLNAYNLEVPFMPPGKTINLITSRGCPHKCAFCSYKAVSGTIVRKRPAAHVFKEMQAIYNKYNISNLYFVDDNFLIDPRRLYQLYELLIESGLKINWRCQTRPDTFLKDSHLPDLIRKMGCRHISFGIESGDQAVIDVVNKELQLIEAERAIDIAKNCGIFVRLFLMVGLPYQDTESITKTIEFVTRTKPDEISVNMFVPYPGSPIYENLHAWGIYIRDKDMTRHICRTDWFDKASENTLTPVIETKWMTCEQIIQAKRDIEFEFIEMKRLGALS